MTDLADDKGAPDTAASTGADPFEDLRDAEPWRVLVREYDRAYQVWNDKATNIEKLYADLKRQSGDGREREMQIFWANLEVLKPSIYSRPPIPMVDAKFKDRKPLVQHSAEVLERCVASAFEKEDIHYTIKCVRDDVALAGRGVLWLRYEAKEDGYQCVRFEHIEREDFGHTVSRKWAEVEAVWRHVYKTRKEMEARFGETSGDAWKQAKFQEHKARDDDPNGKQEKKAKVTEIWHKTKGVVAWIADGPEEVLDIQPPPVDLEGFFPCPRPAYASLERKSLCPVPDFVYYKDQIEETNELTARISALSEGLRLKGFYSAGNEDLSDAIERAIKNTDNNALMIPIAATGMMGAGLKDAIVWMPVDVVAQVLQALVLLRKQLIDDVYQITGLSDIMRGATDPNETLGAQELKSQYGSIRVRDKQEEIVRVCRDAARMAGEIIAENFSPETIMAMSQYDRLPSAAKVAQQIAEIESQVTKAAADPQMVQAAQQNPGLAEQLKQRVAQGIQQLRSQITIDQVIEFLRNERIRAFALEIETDSTIQPDENAAKQRTTEFLAALATALSQLAPMVAAQPQAAEFAGEVLKFAVAPFRAGRQLDAAIDDFTEKMKQQANQPKPPDPAQAKAEADMKIIQAETQARMSEMQLRVREIETKSRAEAQKAAAEVQKANAEVMKTRADVEKIMADIQRIQAGAEASVIAAKAQKEAARTKPAPNGKEKR